MELSNEEVQYIVNAIDTHVRANGISSAAQGILIVQKMQIANKEKLAAAPPPGDSGEG